MHEGLLLKQELLCEELKNRIVGQIYCFKVEMAEMALGYGSEFQLLRYLGHHRNYLNNEIKRIIGDGEIEWLDYPKDLSRDSRDGEFKDIKCFNRLSNYKEIERRWVMFWPQRGNAHNWDGIFTQNGIWYFVEAKANLEEANQECSAKSEESKNKIIKAFEDTCGSRSLAEEWLRSHSYQLANRLAFIHFCEQVGVNAKLLYISFINGYDVNYRKNVCDSKNWIEKWDDEYDKLQLSDELKKKIYHVYLDCHKDGFE